MRMSYDPSDGMQDDRQTVLSTPVQICAVNDTYINRGDIVRTLGFNRILVYPRFTPDTSTGLWVKALIGYDSTDVSYLLPSTSVDEIEIGDKMTAEFILDGLVPFVQLQLKAVALGGSPGTVDLLVVTRAWV